jgi:hypothetical protein
MSTEKKWSSSHTMLCITLLWKPPQSVCLLDQCFSLTTAKCYLCKLGSFQSTSSRKWNYSHVPRYADFTSFQCDTIFIQDLGMLEVGKWNIWQYCFFLIIVGRGDTKFNIWLHRVCRVRTSNFGREEAQSDITSQPQYLAWPAWNTTTYGHVCDMLY